VSIAVAPMEAACFFWQAFLMLSYVVLTGKGRGGSYRSTCSSRALFPHEPPCEGAPACSRALLSQWPINRPRIWSETSTSGSSWEPGASLGVSGC